MKLQMIQCLVYINRNRFNMFCEFHYCTKKVLYIKKTKSLPPKGFFLFYLEESGRKGFFRMEETGSFRFKPPFGRNCQPCCFLHWMDALVNNNLTIFFAHLIPDINIQSWFCNTAQIHMFASFHTITFQRFKKYIRLFSIMVCFCSMWVMTVQSSNVSNIG